MKIAVHPTPFRFDYELREFPCVVPELGYEYPQLTLHRDCIPFFKHPRTDTVMVSSVFAKDENAHDVSRYQLTTMLDFVGKYAR